MTAMLSAIVLAAGIFVSPSPSSSPPLCSNMQAAVEQAKTPDFGGGVTGQSVTCHAYCGDLNAAISCSGTVCSAVDRACSAEPGHITCDGVTTYCAACCTNGQIRNVSTGPNCSCPDGKTSPKDRYLCVNGEWEYQYSFCGGPFCQGF